jgi:hypothetical protein
MDWKYIEDMLVTSDYKGKKVKGEIVSMLREKIEQLQSENDELNEFRERIYTTDGLKELLWLR